MPRSKAPPRVKGPYSERGGTRFRIRICEATGHRDLYFSTKKEALTGIKEATRELPASAKGRTVMLKLDRPSSTSGRMSPLSTSCPSSPPT